MKSANYVFLNAFCNFFVWNPLGHNAVYKSFPSSTQEFVKNTTANAVQIGQRHLVRSQYFCSEALILFSQAIFKRAALYTYSDNSLEL